MGIFKKLKSLIFGRPPAPPAPPPPPPPQYTAPPPPAPAPQIIQTATTENRINLKDFVDESIAAGFNPLTTLRAGVAQGFSQIQTPFLTTNRRYVDWERDQNERSSVLAHFRDLDRDYFGQKYQHSRDVHTFKQSQRDKIFSAINTGISALAGGMDQWMKPVANQVFRRSQDIMMPSRFPSASQFPRPRDTVSPGGVWSAPQIREINNEPGGKTYNDWRDGRFSMAPYPQNWESGDVSVTNPWFGSSVRKDRPDAEIIETRYGEVAGELQGAGNAWYDWRLNNPGWDMFFKGVGTNASAIARDVERGVRAFKRDMGRFSDWIRN